jgi:hypothetical protein
VPFTCNSGSVLPGRMMHLPGWLILLTMLFVGHVELNVTAVDGKVTGSFFKRLFLGVRSIGHGNSARGVILWVGSVNY